MIGSILSGGDSIDDTKLLRAGATGQLFDQVLAQSTIRPLAAGVQMVQRA